MRRICVRYLVVLLSAVVGCLISGFSAKASAQICAGSSLQYVVRDAKGAVIRDPEPVYPRLDRPWSAELQEVAEMDKVIKGATADVMWLIRWRGNCNFKEPVKATLKLDGKQMNLVFLMPKFRQYESRNFLVDSIPFSAGTFEIDLAEPAEPNTAANRYGSFYPASRWKKATVDPQTHAK